MKEAGACTRDRGCSVCHPNDLDSPEISGMFGGVAMEFWPVFHLWVDDNMQIRGFLILASFPLLVTLLAELQTTELSFICLVEF